MTNELAQHLRESTAYYPALAKVAFEPKLDMAQELDAPSPLANINLRADALAAADKAQQRASALSQSYGPRTLPPMSDENAFDGKPIMNFDAHAAEMGRADNAQRYAKSVNDSYGPRTIREPGKQDMLHETLWPMLPGQQREVPAEEDVRNPNVARQMATQQQSLTQAAQREQGLKPQGYGPMAAPPPPRPALYAQESNDYKPWPRSQKVNPGPYGDPRGAGERANLGPDYSAWQQANQRDRSNTLAANARRKQDVHGDFRATPGYATTRAGEKPDAHAAYQAFYSRGEGAAPERSEPSPYEDPRVAGQSATTPVSNAMLQANLRDPLKPTGIDPLKGEAGPLASAGIARAEQRRQESMPSDRKHPSMLSSINQIPREALERLRYNQALGKTKQTDEQALSYWNKNLQNNMQNQLAHQRTWRESPGVASLPTAVARANEQSRQREGRGQPNITLPTGDEHLFETPTENTARMQAALRARGTGEATKERALAAKSARPPAISGSPAPDFSSRPAASKGPNFADAAILWRGGADPYNTGFRTVPRRSEMAARPMRAPAPAPKPVYGPALPAYLAKSSMDWAGFARAANSGNRVLPANLQPNWQNMDPGMTPSWTRHQGPNMDPGFTPPGLAQAQQEARRMDPGFYGPQAPSSQQQDYLRQHLSRMFDGAQSMFPGMFGQGAAKPQQTQQAQQNVSMAPIMQHLSGGMQLGQFNGPQGATNAIKPAQPAKPVQPAQPAKPATPNMSMGMPALAKTSAWGEICSQDELSEMYPALNKR